MLRPFRRWQRGLVPTVHCPLTTQRRCAMTEPAVGLIGLGLMGGGLGRNLLRRGYPLTVYDIDPAAVARLVEVGAVAVESPRAVAARSRFVITVLPDGPQVEAAVTGPSGILAGVAPGTIVVDCSTIDPLVTQR